MEYSDLAWAFKDVSDLSLGIFQKAKEGQEERSKLLRRSGHSLFAGEGGPG
jgi:hypothetical protein